MSSEYSIRLGDSPIRGRVDRLDGLSCTVVKIRAGNLDDPPEQSLALFMPDDRLLEPSLLFHEIAQDLAALLPDVDACCRCVPGTPDDQCAVHGFEAWLQGRVDADGDAIPREEAAEHVESPHRWG